MSWANYYIEDLKKGKTVSFRPKGNSMSPKIESGQLCTVEPVDTDALTVGEVVLCKVNGKQYLHLISAIKVNQFQISNNKNHINGWIGPNSIFGRLVSVV
jgi:hypothetical protein